VAQGGEAMKWGDRVKASAVLKRVRPGDGRREWQSSPLKVPVTAVFLGYRTLSNGIVDFYPDHIEYHGKEYIRAALVSFGPHENPVYAPPDAIKENDHDHL
jgi:hypothetical protein